MPCSIWDKVPSAILVCKGIDCRITTVNEIFRKRVFDYPAIEHVHFMELVRDSEAEAVKVVLASAISDGQLHTVSFALLILDCTDQFPKHVSCDAQITADGDALIISVVLHNCGGTLCQYDDIARDFIADAPTPLHRISKYSSKCFFFLLLLATSGMRLLTPTITFFAQTAKLDAGAAGQVVWANKFELNMMEYSESEYIGMPIANFLCMPPDVLEAAWQILADGNTAYDFFQYWKTKSGKLVAVTNTSNLRRDSSGNVINTRCFVQHDTARQIQAARIESERLVNAKLAAVHDRFLRAVLHELRTPAHGILAQLNPDTNSKDAILQTQLLKMQRLVKDVEHADNFERGKSVMLQFKKLHLLKLLQTVLTTVCSSSTSSDVQTSIVAVSTEQPESEQTDTSEQQLIVLPAEVTCADEALSRILTHLLEIAIRCTSSGYVRLEVSYSAATSAVTCSVVYSASKPLDVTMAHAVCQKYWVTKADDPLFSADGISVGLNVAYNLLQCMGSKLYISCDSDSITRYSFTLQLPVHTTVTVPQGNMNIATDTSSTDDDSTSNSESSELSRSSRLASLSAGTRWCAVCDALHAKQHISNCADNLPTEMKAIETSPKKCEAGRQTPRRPHVLVVDDNTMCQKLMHRVLQAMDCSCTATGDGETAIDLLQKCTEHTFDLVFMNVHLPVLDGITAMHKIKNELSIKFVPVVVAFTADTSDATAEQCMQAGMSSVIHKPTTQQRIRDTVTQYVHI
jgi:CheY-like chemotaxis protein/signal transduction histidine kinase